MQQEKIVLPKFTVPGQNNWIKWVLVGVGGLVVVSVLAFGVALSRRTGTHAVAVSPVNADEAPLSPSAAPRAPAQPAAHLAAAAAVPADTAAAQGQGPGQSPSKDELATRTKSVSHRSHHSRVTHTKTLAKAGSNGKTAGKSDALDELLKRFK